MKQLLLILLLIFSFSTLTGQTNNRIEIDGVVLAQNEENDVEGVTIYNTSSNRGTITNSNGKFKIRAAKNDIIEISALQFESITVKITEDVIESKSLKIYLVEEMNTLDAVLLTYGLSGNLETDIDNIKKPKAIVIDMGNMNMAYEYFDEKAFDETVIRDHLKSITSKGELYNGFNIGEIIKLFSKPKKYKKPEHDTFKVKIEKELIDVYSYEDISEMLNISPDNVEAFIAHVEDNEIDQKLFKDENEVQLIEFLFQQKDLFLKQQNVKK